ncbi:unnamed protein product [Staurois parvus]|uniref:Uncharacterized protein n=1 Tax=Staurois parvus TaxID=386267 RepID=A0ABN9DJX5_9NEOB|nr:unnamed protein product [Staurois parvus]
MNDGPCKEEEVPPEISTDESKMNSGELFPTVSYMIPQRDVHVLCIPSYPHKNIMRYLRSFRVMA